MKFNEFATEAVKQRLDPKCWTGKHKEGTKIKGGVRVNNCVPNESEELDEIDRRGFLKGAGAALGSAALGSVAGNAKAQSIGSIGAGEEPSKYAASQAATIFNRYAQNTAPQIGNWVYENVYKYVMQYFQYTGGRGIDTAITTAYNAGLQVLNRDFEMIYAQAERDKGDSSIAKAFITGRLGLSQASRDEQLKYGGSLERFNLGPTAQGFVQAYMTSLNQSLEQNRPQQQTQQSNRGGASTEEQKIVMDGLTLYYFSKQSPGSTNGELIKSAMATYIKNNNNKDTINNAYTKLSQTLDGWKTTDKNKWDRMNQIITNDAFNIIQSIQRLNSTKKNEFESINQELDEEFDLIKSIIENLAKHNGVDSEVIWEDLESLDDDELYVFATTTTIMETEAWQKANNRDKTDGMSRKAVKTYRREHPGSKLQTAVTTKPSKLKKGSKASKRRKSYCSRSRGQMKMHNISCAKTPDKAICKARRRWNC